MLDWTWLLRAHAGRRLRALRRMDPRQVQEKVLRSLIARGAATRFGRDHEFSTIRTVADYQARVPVREYEDFWDEYWKEQFPRLQDCTWPGLIPYFAMSSGTTRGTTKYLPVSRGINRANTRAAWDVLVHHVANRPGSRILAGRTLVLGGSKGLRPLASGVEVGDLSGIAARFTPFWARHRYFPPRDLEAIGDWETRIDQVAGRSLEVDIRGMTGIPSWLLIFCDHLLEAAGKPGGRLADVYPNLELLVHGGISWLPYRDRFAALLSGSGAETREVYPASEGFLAIADGADGAGLRLLLDNGVFFEFVPEGEAGRDAPAAHWVGDFETGVNYAVVVSTVAGLWRYSVGDTVTVVSRDPPRVLITGRTRLTLSAFGEHVIGAELELAVAEAAEGIGAAVSDFAVGSLHSEQSGERGGHLYLVEFAERSVESERAARFGAVVDAALQRLSQDYRTYRADGWGLDAPRIEVMPPGGFAAWMKRRGKLGGQNKVPRVVNDPEMLGSLRAIAQALRADAEP